MKTPEQIKMGLRCSSSLSSVKCIECAYSIGTCIDDDASFECDLIPADALDYIQRLEADREALLKVAHDYAGCSECIHVDNKPELPPVQ